MDMFECIRTRRSVRQYDPARPVSDEDLRRVLEAATWAPSGGNSQPWHFYVVRQPRLIEAMRKAIRLQCPDDPRVDAVETLFNAPCIIAVCVDVSQRFYHFKPPHLVQDLDDVYNNPDLFSVAAAIQDLLLAAHAKNSRPRAAVPHPGRSCARALPQGAGAADAPPFPLALAGNNNRYRHWTRWGLEGRDMGHGRAQWLSVGEAARRLGISEGMVLARLNWGAYGARLTPDGERQVRVIVAIPARDPLGDTAIAPGALAMPRPAWRG
jgi:hypothetical protein